MYNIVTWFHKAKTYIKTVPARISVNISLIANEEKVMFICQKLKLRVEWKPKM